MNRDDGPAEAPQWGRGGPLLHSGRRKPAPFGGPFTCYHGRHNCYHVLPLLVVTWRKLAALGASSAEGGRRTANGRPHCRGANFYFTIFFFLYNFSI